MGIEPYTYLYQHSLQMAVQMEAELPHIRSQLSRTTQPPTGDFPTAIAKTYHHLALSVDENLCPITEFQSTFQSNFLI